MKKIIIAALTMLTLVETQADYTLKYQLEQAQGGSLPNGSIVFTQPSQEQPQTKECFYLPGIAGSWWRKTLDDKTIAVRWGGVALVQNGGVGAFYMESHTEGGYIYTPGNLIIPEGSFSTYDYEICREPI